MWSECCGRAGVAGLYSSVLCVTSLSVMGRIGTAAREGITMHFHRQQEGWQQHELNISFSLLACCTESQHQVSEEEASAIHLNCV